MSRLREGRVGRSFIAKVPIEHSVVRRNVMDLRLAGARGLGRIDHGRQLGVVDLDLLGRVARLRIGVGDDDGDVIADIAHLALS